MAAIISLFLDMPVASIAALNNFTKASSGGRNEAVLPTIRPWSSRFFVPGFLMRTARVRFTPYSAFTSRAFYRLIGRVPLSHDDWTDLKTFGANLRRERTARQLTQEQFAELADLHLRSVQKIEAGEINLLLTTVFRIKRALKCPWARLLG